MAPPQTRDRSRVSVSSGSAYRRSFSYRLAFLTSCTGFLLVAAGGLVTSTDSGLAVPDWPLSYGTLFPPMVGGIRYEHSHRLIAALVGLLTLGLTLTLLFNERRRHVRWLAIGAFGMVVLQGILGGLTVLWQLPPQISIAHACLGQTFFAVLVLLTGILSPSWLAERLSHSLEAPKTLWPMSVLTVCAVYGQLILGASMRHLGWFPLLLLGHILGAVLVFTLVSSTAGAVLKRYPRISVLSRPAGRLGWLLLIQIVLGIFTFVRGADVVSATLHVAVGALLLANTVLLAAGIYKLLIRPLHPTNLTSRPLKAYIDLTKPRLTMMAVITSLIGLLLACEGFPPAGLLATVLLGTALVGAGAGTLNQYLEREADACMERTKKRPLPSGRLQPERALLFGVLLSVAGLLLLTAGADPAAGGLAALTLASYLFLYTPLKSRSALCTLIGAVPGAIPPMIGWAAARQTLSIEAWFLFWILFLWQLPHFLAIAWTYKEDYTRAGFKMLPVLDPEGGTTGRQIVLYCLALIPVSLMPAAFGFSGWLYFLAALVSGCVLFQRGLAAARLRSGDSARRLFTASIFYLPVLMTTMTLDKVIL